MKNKTLYALAAKIHQLISMYVRKLEYLIGIIKISKKFECGYKNWIKIMNKGNLNKTRSFHKRNVNKYKQYKNRKLTDFSFSHRFCLGWINFRCCLHGFVLCGIINNNCKSIFGGWCRLKRIYGYFTFKILKARVFRFGPSSIIKAF